MNADRLLALASFLRRLSPAHWDYSTIASGGRFYDVVDGDKVQTFVESGKGCGSVGCAVGWLPGAFPEDFRWGEKYERSTLVALRGDMEHDGMDPFAAAAEFFGIVEGTGDHKDEVLFLFDYTAWMVEVEDFLDYPDDFESDDYAVGGMDPADNEESTHEAVAEHIEKFVKHGGIYVNIETGEDLTEAVVA